VLSDSKEKLNMKRQLKIFLVFLYLIGLMTIPLSAGALDNRGQSGVSATQVSSLDPKRNQNDNKQQTVLAIVNGHKITQAELDAVSTFPLNGIADPALRAQARNKILQDLIDEYLVDQDIANSALGKNSIFTSLLEREKRVAALNLYKLFKASESPPKLIPSDIDAFIRSHEDYFSKRKTWHFYQFILPPQSTNIISYDEFRQASQKFDEKQFSAWLIDKGIDFERTNVWQGSEQMPQDVLEGLSKLKSGTTFVSMLRNPNTKASSSAASPATNGLRVIYFVDAYPDPIDPAQARNSVARNLISQANRLKILDVMDEVRAKAKIEIFETSALSEISTQNQASQERVSERRSMRQMEYVRTAWFFCFLILVPLALWKFYKSVPEISKYKGSLRRLQKLEQTVYMRSLETLLAGFLLFFPLLRFILERLIAYDFKVITIAAVVGLSVALAVLLMIKKIPLLAELNENRFLALISLFVLQYMAMVI
jgi:EpsD family peptidyl-prolyl cis-trans isomerase